MSAVRLRVLNQLDLAPCNGCDECGLRCAEGVPMTRSEYDAVQEWIARSPKQDRIAQIQLQDKRVDLGDDVEVRMCRYRDMAGGGCSIYPARPAVCRLMGHVEWMPCPIDKVTKPLRTSDALAIMAEMASERRETFEGWESAGAA